MTLRLRRLPPPLLFGLAILLAELAVALAADRLFPGDPLDMVGLPLVPPGTDPDFPLGTDMLGRDIAAGLVHGTRLTLVIGLSAMLIATTIGTLVGLLAGYFGGVADHALMRVAELFQAIPHFLFAILVIAVLGTSFANTVLAIGVTSWPMVARLVRAETLLVRELDFVKAAAAMGAGHGRLMLVHVLPNALPPVVTAASILTAIAVMTEAGLAFLGLGDANRVSWGGMIGAGRESLREAAYICLVPGAAIVATVLALSALGDGIARRVNPRAGR